MRVLPSRSFRVRLCPNDNDRWGRLALKTEPKDSLISVRTQGKLFIGQVSLGHFHLIRTPIGSGALCVFRGDFNDTSGTLDVQIHKVFQFLIGTWLLLPIGSIAWGFCKEGPLAGTTTALGVFVLLTLIRGALGVFFRIQCDKGIRELTEVLHFAECKPFASMK